MSSKKPFPEHIIWLDLETSGSDSATCEIVEVGVIATDQKFKEIDRFATVVGNFNEDQMREWPEVVQKMHQTSGLWYDLAFNRNPTVAETEKLLLQWLDDFHPSKTHVALAGSGVGHFDRAFIEKYWPTFARRLTYWPLDIGVPRRFFLLFDFPWIEEAKTHRGIADAEHHLNEAIYFRRIVTMAKAYMKVNGYTTDPEAFHADDWIWE